MWFLNSCIGKNSCSYIFQNVWSKTFINANKIRAQRIKFWKSIQLIFDSLSLSSPKKKDYRKFIHKKKLQRLKIWQYNTNFIFIAKELEKKCKKKKKKGRKKRYWYYFILKKKKERKSIAKRRKREREKERRKTLDKVGIPISSSSFTPWPAGIRVDRSPSIRNGSTRTCSTMIDRLLTSFCHWKRSEPLEEPWTIYDFERVIFVSNGKERKGNLNWILWWIFSHLRNSGKKSTFILDWTIQISIFHQKFT